MSTFYIEPLTIEEIQSLYGKNATKPEKIAQHEPGTKLDSDKPDLDLVLGSFTKALVEVGKVGTFGAKKYSDNGWKKVPNAQRRYLSAMQRHYYTYKDDELLDPETHLSHLAHMSWNALAALHFELEKIKTLENIDVK